MENDTRRRALDRFQTGVYVLTSRNGDHFGAATVAWAMQTSFKPSLIVVALGRKSNVFRCLEHSRVAVLHVAGHRQLGLARRFACPTETAGTRINGEPFVNGVTSAPVLKVFPAYLECQVEQIVDTIGDHALVILRVVLAQCRARFRPMTIAELRTDLERHPLPPRREPAPAQVPLRAPSPPPASCSQSAAAD